MERAWNGLIREHRIQKSFAGGMTSVCNSGAPLCEYMTSESWDATGLPFSACALDFVGPVDSELTQKLSPGEFLSPYLWPLTRSSVS